MTDQATSNKQTLELAPNTNENFEILTDTQKTFEFKGNSYTLTTFKLHEYNLELIDLQLKEALNANWNFFHNAPIVIDLKPVYANSSAIRLDLLRDVLVNNHFIPVGVINANLDMQKNARKCNLAVLHSYTFDKTQSKYLKNRQKICPKLDSSKIRFKEGKICFSKTTEKLKINIPNEEKRQKQFPHDNDLSSNAMEQFLTNTTLITEKVRSGQKIYARGGDLIITASVSPGAEVLADGNVHVYGTLYGKAFAGINGNVGARIFCINLQAELLSIAGQYMISEDIEKIDINGPTQVRIVKENLHIESI